MSGPTREQMDPYSTREILIVTRERYVRFSLTLADDALHSAEQFIDRAESDRKSFGFQSADDDYARAREAVAHARQLVRALPYRSETANGTNNA